MVIAMTLLKNTDNKKGVYILEAAIIVPPLIIAMVLLISVVSMIGAAEKALFAMGDELKFAGIKSAFSDEGLSTPLMIKHRISNENPIVGNVSFSDYGYLHSEKGVEDLISVGVNLSYSGINPLGSSSFFSVEQRVRSRAFTGLDRSGDFGEHALSGYEKSEIVYIFPNHGEKYHNRSCGFLNPASERVFLTKDIKAKFRACSICHSGSSSLGDVVFCFFTDGKVYHLGKCSAVDKYYTEIEKKDAEARGYLPCASCGG